jgi:hypothetical protein
MMGFYYCPSCAQVFFLPEAAYLCSRTHVVGVWKDGKKRKFVVSQRVETDRQPWAIPEVVEEKEVLNQDQVDSWLDECQNPSDSATDFTDYRRHFGGYQTFGGRHLTRAQVIDKFGDYVLRPAKENPEMKAPGDTTPVVANP